MCKVLYHYCLKPVQLDEFTFRIDRDDNETLGYRATYEAAIAASLKWDRQFRDEYMREGWRVAPAEGEEV